MLKAPTTTKTNVTNVYCFSFIFSPDVQSEEYFNVT